MIIASIVVLGLCNVTSWLHEVSKAVGVSVRLGSSNSTREIPVSAYKLLFTLVI